MIDTVALVIIAVMSSLTGLAAILVLVTMFGNRKANKA